MRLNFRFNRHNFRYTKSTNGYSIPGPDYPMPDPNRMDRHRRDGRRHGRPPPLSRLLLSVVFTVVGHPQDVRQVLLSESDGVLPALSPNSVVVDHTTSRPDLAEEIAHAARQNRCWAVDVGARTGELSLFAGGDPSVVDWLSPLFKITCHKVSHMGPAGSGQSCKIGNQIALTGSFKGLSEALFFAGRAGLEKERWLAAAMGCDGGSRVMEVFGKRAVERDLRSAGYVEYLVKDVGMGVGFVEGGGGGGGGGSGSAVLPGAAQNKQLFLSMVANGDGKLSPQGLITAIERINGEFGKN